MESMVKAVAIFVGLAVVYAVLLLVSVNLASPFGQLILVSLGSAIFGSGLTFLLIRATRTDDRK